MRFASCSNGLTFSDGFDAFSLIQLARSNFRVRSSEWGIFCYHVVRDVRVQCGYPAADELDHQHLLLQQGGLIALTHLSTFMGARRSGVMGVSALVRHVSQLV